MLIILSLMLISSATCSAYVKVYDDVKHKIAEEGSADVIVVFEKIQEDNSEGIHNAKSMNINGVSGVSSGVSDRGPKNPRLLSNEVLKEVSTVKGFSKRMQFIDGYSGELTEEGLENLMDESSRKGVTMTVYENTIFQVLYDAPSNSSDFPTIFSTLNVSTAAVNANYSWNILNVTGRGVRVAILDTGIDYNHPDLGGCFGNFTNDSCKVFGGYDYYYNDSDPMDDGGHGTHVAGILAADGAIRGVAPDAIIYSFKVCSNAPGCEVINEDCGCPTDIIRSALMDLDSYNISVASMSLGALLSWDPTGNSGKYLLSREVSETIEQGITIVVSAGNSGKGVSTVTSPGDSELAITIGAINDSNTYTVSDDSVWIESSRGPSLPGRLDPDMVAPGVSITSTYPPNGEWEMSGTSMATPFVSGAVALMLEKYPSLTPSQVRAILMQSSANVAGKVFEKGAGELDVKNALVAPIYAVVDHVNTYGMTASTDRWEFVIIPYTTSHANITLINDFIYSSGYNFTFNISVENITNLENDMTLNTSQLSVQSSINVTADLNITFNVSFALSNFSTTYATTYGGTIILSGSGSNGTDSVNKTLRIPIAVTVPIMNYGYLNRTMYNPPSANYTINTFTHEDVYNYCYYNPYPRNVTFRINWTGTSTDLDLFVYNSTGDIDVYSNSPGTEYESIYTAKSDLFKWFRIDGWAFTPPLTFNINITESGNANPTFVNIMPINGSINSTNTFMFYRPKDIILNISYYDMDNDTVTVSANDSSYASIGNGSIPPNGYVVLDRNYNSTMPRDSVISITLQDAYGAVTTQSLNILSYSSITINSHNPSNSTLYVRQNGSQAFMLDVTDMNNATLYYYWRINGTVNGTMQNFTFNTTHYNSTLYNLSVVISNSNATNETNETLSWNVYVDGVAPTVTILKPAAVMYNNSKTYINYSVSDTSSGVDSCWYSINGTLYGGGGGVNHTNISLSSCSNTSIYLGSGQYSLNIYSNDTLGNTGYSNVLFSVNDTTSPNITNSSPSGTLSYTTSVTLSVLTDENATCRYNTTDVDYGLMNGTLSGTVVNDTVSHTATYSANVGVNTLFVRCRDMSNNTNNESASIMFTVSNPPSGDTDGGKRRSGGGGGGTSYYYDSDSDFYSNVFGTLDEGETNISINKDDIPVSQLTVHTDLPLSNVTINMSNIEEPDVNYTDDPVSSYIEIIGENIPSEVVVSTKIYFSVTFEWLNKSNITKNNVVLLLYDYDVPEWRGLLTTLLGEDNISVYYVAESPKFGLYAISANQTASRSGNAITEELEKDMIVNKTLTPQVLSGEDGLKDSTGSTSGLQGEVKDASANSDNILMAVGVLCGILLLSVLSMAIIRSRVRKDYMKKYRYDVIIGAEEELKHLDDIFIPKAPGVFDKIRKRFSKESRKEQSKESKKR